MNISPTMIKAILFDLDDLMVNSAPLHVEASRRIFSQYGVDVGTIPDAVMASYYGERVAEILKKMVAFFHLEGKVNVEKLHEEREKTFIGLVRAGIEPMPGLFELLSALRPEKFKKAIASSGTKVYIGVVLEKLGIGDDFDAVVSGDMVEHAKPSPDIFLKAAKMLRVKPSECVVIEDSEKGVLAAKRAGMRCIGVENPESRFRQDIEKADVVVGRLDEIDVNMLRGGYDIC